MEQFANKYEKEFNVSFRTMYNKELEKQYGELYNSHMKYVEYVYNILSPYINSDETKSIGFNSETFRYILRFHINLLSTHIDASSFTLIKLINEIPEEDFTLIKEKLISNATLYINKLLSYYVTTKDINIIKLVFKLIGDNPNIVKLTINIM